MIVRSKQQTWRKSVFVSSPQTATVLKMSMNISYYIYYAVLLQEAIIARNPNNQFQTQKDLKWKKKRSLIPSCFNAICGIRVSEYV